jgi:hypothetical protein
MSFFILVSTRKEFVLGGKKIMITCRGVRATIADYSLSRVRVPSSDVMFADQCRFPSFTVFDKTKP